LDFGSLERVWGLGAINQTCHPGSERRELSGISFTASAKEIPDDAASRVSGMTRVRRGARHFPRSVE